MGTGANRVMGGGGLVLAAVLVAGGVAAATTATRAESAMGEGTTPLETTPPLRSGSELDSELDPGSLAASTPSKGGNTTAGAGRAVSVGDDRVPVPPAVGPRWRWPVVPRPDVVRPFRKPATPYGPGHRGLDLSIPPGTRVLAVEAGRVRHAGTVAGRGTVTVEHLDGLLSTYEPLAPSVRAGQLVEVGDVLGILRVGSGSAHCGARTCLHLGARRDGAYLDPLPLLTGGRLALLPLG